MTLTWEITVHVTVICYSVSVIYVYRSILDTFTAFSCHVTLYTVFLRGYWRLDTLVIIYSWYKSLLWISTIHSKWVPSNQLQHLLSRTHDPSSQYSNNHKQYSNNHKQNSNTRSFYKYPITSTRQADPQPRAIDQFLLKWYSIWILLVVIWILLVVIWILWAGIMCSREEVL